MTLWPNCSQSGTLAHENELRRQGYSLIGGIDEVGRGPLAGPVVAACVILPAGCEYRRFVDSKRLRVRERNVLSAEIREIGAHIGFGVISEKDIDELNILKASLLAMRRAVESLAVAPDFLLVDGKHSIPFAIPQRALIKGESQSASIAAASIVAKVFRDALMDEYHQQFPGYNFLQNKGYPTKEHRKALQLLGPCPIHRTSFRGVRELVIPFNADEPRQIPFR